MADEWLKVNVDGTILDVEDTFCYLNDMLCSSGGCDSAIAVWLLKTGWNTFGFTNPETWGYYGSPSQSAAQKVWTCTACHAQYQICQRCSDFRQQGSRKAQKDVVWMCKGWCQRRWLVWCWPVRRRMESQCQTLRGAANPTEWNGDNTLISKWIYGWWCSYSSKWTPIHVVSKQFKDNLVKLKTYLNEVNMCHFHVKSYQRR